ncbi:uncharacterized protein LOC120346196 [Styela clava]
MASDMHIVSTHLTPLKDRGLATALLRISERRSLKDEFDVEKVVYCAAEEPFKGWTNAAPSARYSVASRPREVGQGLKKKRGIRKSKILEAKDSLTDLYAEIVGMTTRADGHYHASATIQELYEEYKKRQGIEDHIKIKSMIDPITFRYIPRDERTDEISDDGSIADIKLPVLKMTHANKQTKLLEVLENFMSRKSDENGKRIDTEQFSVKGRDAASFYDKYKWYFKDKQGGLSRNIKIKRPGRHRNIKKRVVDGKTYYSESGSEESMKKNRRKRRHSYPPTYVIKVKDENSKTTAEETITFEKKTDYGLSAPGAPGIDRWVARVVIRDSQDQDDGESYTSTTASQISENAIRNKTNKLQNRATKQFAKNTDSAKQPDYRLPSKRGKKRPNKRLPRSFYDLYHISAVETAKVSMKYNVSVGKRQGTLPELETEQHSDDIVATSNKDIKSNHISKTLKPTPIHSMKHVESTNTLKLNSRKVVPVSKKSNVLDTISDENEDAQSQVNSKNKSDIALPPLQAKRPPIVSKDSIHKPKKRKKTDSKKSQKDDDGIFSLPRTLESSEERQIKTPSSSTFNPDRMFQQMRDTADFITKASTLSKSSKSIQSSPRFLSKIEDARTSDVTSSNTKYEEGSRKPLHPRHNKNRAQDKLQQLIDEEKLLVSQVIKQINTSLQEENLNFQKTPVPEVIQDALSTAIAKTRLAEIHGTAFPGNSGSRTLNMQNVIKRRVVPPVKGKSSVPTAMVGSGESFFITDTIKHAANKPTISTLRQSGLNKKPDGKKPQISNAVRSLSKERNESFKRNKLQPGVRFVAEGDLLLANRRAFAPAVPGIFEASISSIKPARRIANVNQPFDIRQRA